MLTAHRIDRIERERHETSMDTTIRCEAGHVYGRTRIWTDRVASTVVGGVRAIAVDAAGKVVAFSGERRIRVGARPLPTADRTVEWSSALFADDPVGAVRLEVVHFRPPRRRGRR